MGSVPDIRQGLSSRETVAPPGVVRELSGGRREQYPLSELSVCPEVSVGQNLGRLPGGGGGIRLGVRTGGWNR